LRRFAAKFHPTVEIFEVAKDCAARAKPRMSLFLIDRSPMKSTWRKHLIICLFLGLLAVPIYFVDLACTGAGGGGNWITLDFRGLIFWTYITLLAIHLTLSSIAILSFPKSGVLRIHLGSMVLSLILFVAGLVVYGKLRRLEMARSQRTLMESRQPLINVIELKEWWYSPMMFLQRRSA
jgi:hypothetical protein